MLKITATAFLFLSAGVLSLFSGQDQDRNNREINLFSTEELEMNFHLNCSEKPYGHFFSGNEFHSKEIHLGGTPAQFYEMDKNTDGKSVSEKGNQKRLGRALFLNFSLVIVDSIRYWIKYSKWIEDWQYELTWEDQKKRFFTLEANRFDSNPFLTNWSHIVSGAAYYNFARYNQLNTLESILFMFGSSLFWEYVTEWREVISIGDNICSGIGGISIGEPLYWIGSYFTQKKGLLNKIIGGVFNPVVAFNDLLDKNKYKRKLANTRPRFDLFCGPKQVSVNGDNTGNSMLFNAGFDIQYYTIDGYEKPGTINRAFKSTIKNEFSGDVTLGANSVEEYCLFTRAVLFGHFKQKLIPDDEKGIKGYSFIFGAGTAFDFFKKKSVVYYDKGEYHYDFAGGEEAPQPTEFSDKLAILNLIGPVLELSLLSRDTRFRVSAEAYFDFALVNSLAINAYSVDNDLYDPRIKTTLSYYGYYYAFGFTLSSDILFIHKNFELKGKWKYQYYDSIEGLDRFQDELTDDSTVLDSRIWFKLSLGFSFSHTPIKILVAYEKIDRQGSFKDFFQNIREKRIYTQLRISF